VSDSATAYRVPQYKAVDVVSIVDSVTSYKVPQYVSSDVVGVEDGVVVCKTAGGVTTCDTYATCVCNVNIAGTSV